VAFDSFMMTSSRLAHPITDSVHPTLKRDWAALRLWRHFLTVDQTGLWIRGSSRRTEVAAGACWRPCRCYPRRLRCQSCQDQLCVTSVCVLGNPGS